MAVYVLGAIAACLVGALPLVGQPSREATIATLSGVLVASIGFAGRRDLTRPHVALPLVWFTAVTVAQLKLLPGGVARGVFEGPVSGPGGTTQIFRCAVW